ncbi:PTR2-domain-containing protein, partial [Atractiella rhizophila]
GSNGPFSNFIQFPLPEGGNGAGAVAPGSAGKNQHAGALDQGLQAANALTLLFTFLAYTIPIYESIVADTKWGRFKTICVGTAVGAIAHVLLVIPAIPSVIASGNALAPFIIALLILAFAAGFVKPSLGPLLCDQCPIDKQQIKTLSTGERVILDPEMTIQKYLTNFYWAINIGAFFSVATSYSERYVGFWLAYLLPGIVYMIMPVALWWCHSRLRKFPPQGSMFLEGSKVIAACYKNGGWKRAFKGGDAFWDQAKPSIQAADGVSAKSSWDDLFVDEVRRSVKACYIFFLIPIFNVADGGFGSVQNSQAASLTANGVPNDVISNFNPLTIIVAAPLLNYVIYPFLRKHGLMPGAIPRIAFGFFLASLTMVAGAILQWQVYEQSPCGYHSTDCDEVAPISLWAQIPLYSIPAIAELFVNVTSYEIAYTRAPAKMKGLVYGICLFSSALSSAFLQIVNPFMKDPDLIWPFVAAAVANFLVAIALPFIFSDTRKELVNLDLSHSRMDKVETESVEEKVLTDRASLYEEKHEKN